MVYDKVYHIALTEQEFNQLQQLIQAGNRLAHLYLGVNPICTEYFEWHRPLSTLYSKLMDLHKPAKPIDGTVDDNTHPSIQPSKSLH